MVSASIVTVLAVGVLVVAGIAVPAAGWTASAQQLPGPQFEISALQGPTEATVGASITVTARVRNTGSSSGTVRLQYRFGNETRVTKSRTLNAGGSSEVSYTVRVPDVAAGTYRHGVFIEGTDAGRAMDIRVQRPAPRIRISEFTGPSQARSGDQLTVRATAVNTGTSAERTTVQYRIRGDVLASETLSLAAGGSATVFFSVTVPDLQPDAYTQGVYVAGTEAGQTAQLLITDASRFAITELDAPAVATVGDRVDVAATVTNTGSGQGSAEIQYRIGGGVVATQPVTLTPGESRRVAFTTRVPSLAAGTYSQGLYLGSTSQGQSTTIEVAGTPRLEILSVTAPSTARMGEAVRLEATVENAGTGPGSATIEYVLDGEVVATSDVTLRTGERTTLSATVGLDDRAPGTYTVGVGITGTDQRRTSRLTVVGTGTPTPRVVTRTVDPTTSPGMPGFGVPVAILAVVLFFVASRRVRD